MSVPDERLVQPRWFSCYICGYEHEPYRGTKGCQLATASLHFREAAYAFSAATMTMRDALRALNRFADKLTAKTRD